MNGLQTGLGTTKATVAVAVAVIAAWLPWATPAIAVFDGPGRLLLTELAVAAVIALVARSVRGGRTYWYAAAGGTAATAAALHWLFINGPGWSS